MSVTGILLAAGQSRRFGKNKLLHPVRGTPLAVISARKLRAAAHHALAVVRPESTRLIRLLRYEGLQIITCTAARNGMGASLACGVKASLNAQSWVIMLADMPFVQMETLNKLVTLLTQGALIALPVYQRQRGHPVGFNRQFRTQLSRLSGDAGARSILQRYPDQITTFACNDAGIHQDIDTYQDLKGEYCGHIQHES